ncbi:MULTISPECIES: glycosyltransferase family 2 protein [Flavobacteriaceae]|uniref:Glycosyltransferase family 2 protein n=2 Tax=Flavobacteriaceae TaxID=49546 RepID=A0A4Y8AWQ7_9FLAO|nr:MULTISPECIES: glycosyltransferase family 2 protein [Flavobacteriaceae]TEW76575.1 glycosyltransferase family 2 protein [Gramella jeungdoensis]GGK60760.1 hypothetical protein GCM10007963_31030 [Lutibacter litoralis]
MQNPLVSIIIPTYNRAHLIGETLDSVIAQTYSNWECIVVDDGSTDTTDEVLKMYCEKDSRIQYHHRPKDRLPGGNAARNYGFELCKGEYVNWFDSDDLMILNFIEKKVLIINKFKVVDFVISKCINFFEDGTTQELNLYRDIEFNELNADNFICNKVGWITQDMMIKKESIGNIFYDEFLKSGQEYNFIIKLLALKKLKGFFLNEILSKRRIHSEAIQIKLHTNKLEAITQKFVCQIRTYKAVKHALNKKTRNKMLGTCINLYKTFVKNHKSTPYFTKFIMYFILERGLVKWFVLSLYSVFLFFNIESSKFNSWIK